MNEIPIILIFVCVIAAFFYGGMPDTPWIQNRAIAVYVISSFVACAMLAANMLWFFAGYGGCLLLWFGWMMTLDWSSHNFDKPQRELGDLTKTTRDE